MLSWLSRGGGVLLGAAVALVIVALGQGCGSLGASEGFGGASSSSGAGSSGGADSGGSSGSFGDGGSESGSSSSGGDSGGLAPTTALVVQASPSLPDVRLCVAKGGTPSQDVPFPGTGEMPASNYPGIPLGGAAAMGDAAVLTDPSVTLFALDAQQVALRNEGQSTPWTCNDLLHCGQTQNPPSPCLRYDRDYWPVATPSGAVQLGKSNVLALGGCLNATLDPTADATRCGSTWSPVAGNLHVEVFQLAPASAGPDGGVIAVQAAQLSPGLAAMVAAGGAGDAGIDGGGEGGAPAGSGVVVSFGARDAGDASVVATLGALGDVEPHGAPYSAAYSGSLPAFGTTGFAIDVAGAGDAGGVHLWMSLAQAQQLVDPTQDPTQFFGHGQTYLLAVLGDPSAPPAFGSGGVYDGKGLHLLVVTAPAGP